MTGSSISRCFPIPPSLGASPLKESRNTFTKKRSHPSHGFLHFLIPSFLGEITRHLKVFRKKLQPIYYEQENIFN